MLLITLNCTWKKLYSYINKTVVAFEIECLLWAVLGGRKARNLGERDTGVWLAAENKMELAFFIFLFLDIYPFYATVPEENDLEP